MKILLLNNYFNIRGGSEIVFLDTFKILKSHGHEVKYFAFDENLDNNVYSKDGVRLSSKGMAKNTKTNYDSIIRFIYNKYVKEELTLFLQDFKPDIVHLHIFYGGLSNSILDVFKPDQKIVWTIHEYRALCPSYLMLDNDLNICELCPKMGRHNSVIKKCTKNSYSKSLVVFLETFIRDHRLKNRVNYYIFVSNFIKNKHIQYRSNINDISSVVYNSIRDPKTYYNLSVGLDINCKYEFIYVGRISREKGIDTFLDVASKLKCSIAVVGDGPGLEGLMVKFKNYSNVKFLGRLDTQAVFKVMAESQYTVVPSEWYESLGLVAIESMSLGVPVIGADIGGISEIIEHDEWGYLFESGNPKSLENVLINALNMPEEGYKKLRLNARQNFEKNFSQNTYYSRLVEIYHKILNA